MIWVTYCILFTKIAVLYLQPRKLKAKKTKRRRKRRRIVWTTRLRLMPQSRRKLEWNVLRSTHSPQHHTHTHSFATVTSPEYSSNFKSSNTVCFNLLLTFSFVFSSFSHDSYLSSHLSFFVSTALTRAKSSDKNTLLYLFHFHFIFFISLPFSSYNLL